MIRDPSDGTVRETSANTLTGGPSQSVTLRVSDLPKLPAASGLATDKMKADEIERLRKSREWVKNWHHRKTTPPEQGEG